jgi:very-short-patch-repair endonuclease
MKSARILCKELRYIDWRNFHNVIKRAKGLINSGKRKGVISEKHTEVRIGKGAYRSVIDYEFDHDAELLITELAGSFKVINHYPIRNECVLLSLLKKYCHAKNLSFIPQYNIGNYFYDAFVAEKILIEFDEPHHLNKRQSQIDNNKNTYAKDQNLLILRFGIESDIIDIILAIEPFLYLQNNQVKEMGEQ